jgi:predicted peroxiredoxin
MIQLFSDCIGAGAIEFILCHAEVEIAFVEEKKIAEVCSVAYSGILVHL